MHPCAGRIIRIRTPVRFPGISSVFKKKFHHLCICTFTFLHFRKSCTKSMRKFFVHLIIFKMTDHTGFFYRFCILSAVISKSISISCDQKWRWQVSDNFFVFRIYIWIKRTLFPVFPVNIGGKKNPSSFFPRRKPPPCRLNMTGSFPS